MKIIATVGLTGSGKSVVSNYLISKEFYVIRFGEIVVKEMKKRGLPITPENERAVREDMRRHQGMDVCAKIALPLIKSKLEDGQLVVIDNLASFSEYKILKQEFGDDLVVLAVFTPKKIRYQRLALRPERPFSQQEAEERDRTEIEKIEKGGAIALADFTLINDGTPEQLFEKIEALLIKLIQS